MNPLVSIIVPFSEATSGFVKCLESLVNQTLQEIEILLIPEQANEEVFAVVKEYQQRDPRILIFPEKEGCLPRNTGLKNATGKFITFLDPDGWVQEETYEKLYEIASQGEMDILMGNGSYCYRSGRKTEIYKSSAPSVSEEVLSGKDAFIFLSRYGEVNLTPAISLYKREFIEKTITPSRVISMKMSCGDRSHYAQRSG
ncbi:MAG: glycosyltransferase [Tannerellaceae bacterium]|nr:glycosyltransferase [Tannerellaceae bacterium]